MSTVVTQYQTKTAQHPNALLQIYLEMISQATELYVTTVCFTNFDHHFGMFIFESLLMTFETSFIFEAAEAVQQYIFIDSMQGQVFYVRSPSLIKLLLKYL